MDSTVIPFPTQVPRPLEASALTHQGRVRGNNEDAYVCRPKRGIFLVADGIGGHPGGEVASALASRGAYEALKEPGHGFARLEKAFGRAHDAVRAEAKRKPELTSMGTTLTALLLDGTTVFVGHAGDSRAYMVRDRKIHPLTRDHVHGRFLANAIGIEHSVNAEIGSFEARSGDIFLLCSDGLTGPVLDELIEDLLVRSPSTEAACKALVDAALKAGGPDNVTVVVVRVA